MLPLHPHHHHSEGNRVTGKKILKTIIALGGVVLFMFLVMGLGTLDIGGFVERYVLHPLGDFYYSNEN